MKLLVELLGLTKTRPVTSAQTEEDPTQKLQRIRAKASAYDAQRQKQAEIKQQEGGIMDPRKARALTAQPSTNVPQTPEEVLANFKSQVTRLLSSYTGKAELERLYIELKKQGDDPLTKAKRQIAFNALTGGGRGNFESKQNTKKAI